MQRTELISTLKIVEPALAAKDLIPVFACFCFSDETVLAYDDIVAIQAPCQIGVKGGLRGRVLLDFLAASKARELEFVFEEKEINLKAGRSKLKLPLIPPDEFIFAFPPTDQSTSVSLESGDFITAINKCSISMGLDPSKPWGLGITIIFEAKKGITFYSTDNLTASRVHLDCDVAKGARGKAIIMPPKFADLLVQMATRNKPLTFSFTSEWIQVAFESGVKLFARTIDDVQVKKYTTLFTEISAQTDGKDYEIPKGFESSLDRAMVVLAASTVKSSQLTVKEGKLKLFSESAYGEVRDTHKFPEHPDAEAHFSPEFIKRALLHSERVKILPKVCMILSNNGFTHLVTKITPAK